MPLTLGLWRDSWLLLFKDQTSTWLSSSSHVTELIGCEQRLSTALVLEDKHQLMVSSKILFAFFEFVTERTEMCCSSRLKQECSRF